MQSLVMERTEFAMWPVPPFRLDLTAWALRRRPTNTMDLFAGGDYMRVLVVGQAPVGVRVHQAGSLERPRLQVVVEGRRISPGVEESVRREVSEILGLNANLESFYSMSSKHPKLNSLVSRFKGMKPPRFPSIFETLVNAIACQQVSLSVGLLLLSRLSRKYGEAPGFAGQKIRSFPTVDAVSRAGLMELRGMGFSLRKAEYVQELAKSASSGRLNLDDLKAMNDQVAVEFLMQIRGVGRWSAEYTLLRGLGRLGVFPGDDVGGQSGLRGWMGLRKNPNYERVQELVGRWQGFRGLVYFHLLLRGLEERGYLEPNGRETLR